MVSPYLYIYIYIYLYIYLIRSAFFTYFHEIGGGPANLVYGSLFSSFLCFSYILQ